MTEQNKYLTKNSYFKKAKLAALVLTLTPFVRMVGLNGSLARGEATKSSDIDFLIIGQKNRLWTCRAFSMILTAIFGLKRYENKIAGRVCLNLYQSDDHLSLSYLEHPASPEWLARNYAYTLPLYQKRGIFHEFIKANLWVYKFEKKFYYENYKISVLYNIGTVFFSFLRFLGEFIFDFIFNNWGENFLRQYQIKRIKKDARTLKSKPGEIVLSDKEIRFHLTRFRGHFTINT